MMDPSKAPVPVVQIPPVERDWTSSVYPRFHLSATEITLLLQRFLPNQILDTKDIKDEINAMQCWLAANPVRAGRLRGWYKFAFNWLRKAEEVTRARGRNRRPGGPRVSVETDADSADRIIAALRSGRSA